MNSFTETLIKDVGREAAIVLMIMFGTIAGLIITTILQIVKERKLNSDKEVQECDAREAK